MKPFIPMTNELILTCRYKVGLPKQIKDKKLWLGTPFTPFLSNAVFICSC